MTDIKNIFDTALSLLDEDGGDENQEEATAQLPAETDGADEEQDLDDLIGELADDPDDDEDEDLDDDLDDEDDDEDLDDEDEDEEPRTFELKVDGKIKRVDEAEVIRLAQMGEHYHQSMNELDQQVKAFEAEAEALTEAAEVLDELTTTWQENPVQFLSSSIAELGDGAQDLALAVFVELAEMDIFDERVVSALGLNEGGALDKRIAKRAERDRLARLEAKIDGLGEDRGEQQREQPNQSQQLLEQVQQQFRQLAGDEGLSFATVEEERAALKDLLQYAVENKLTSRSVEAVYTHRERQRIRDEQAAKQKAEQRKQKRRKASAVSGRSRSARERIPQDGESVKSTALRLLEDLDLED